MNFLSHPLVVALPEIPSDLAGSSDTVTSYPVYSSETKENIRYDMYKDSLASAGIMSSYQIRRGIVHFEYKRSTMPTSPPRSVKNITASLTNVPNVQSSTNSRVNASNLRRLAMGFAISATVIVAATVAAVFFVVVFGATSTSWPKSSATFSTKFIFMLKFSKTTTTTLQNKVHRFRQSFATDLQAFGFD
ncbi:unnamed protein product [Rotaria socialis]